MAKSKPKTNKKAAPKKAAPKKAAAKKAVPAKKAIAKKATPAKKAVPAKKQPFIMCFIFYMLLFTTPRTLSFALSATEVALSFTVLTFFKNPSFSLSAKTDSSSRLFS